MNNLIILIRLLFPAYLIAINILTFFVYGSDKLLAKANAWRVRERTLLILALLGGSVGALLAMRIFRHKTKKPLFGLLFVVILLGQLALIFLLINYARALYSPVSVFTTTSSPSLIKIGA